MLAIFPESVARRLGALRRVAPKVGDPVARLTVAPPRLAPVAVSLATGSKKDPAHEGPGALCFQQ